MDFHYFDSIPKEVLLIILHFVIDDDVAFVMNVRHVCRLFFKNKFLDSIYRDVKKKLHLGRFVGSYPDCAKMNLTIMLKETVIWSGIVRPKSHITNTHYYLEFFIFKDLFSISVPQNDWIKNDILFTRTMVFGSEYIFCVQEFSGCFTKAVRSWTISKMPSTMSQIILNKHPSISICL